MKGPVKYLVFYTPLYPLMSKALMVEAIKSQSASPSALMSAAFVNFEEVIQLRCEILEPQLAKLQRGRITGGQVWRENSRQQGIEKHNWYSSVSSCRVLPFSNFFYLCTVRLCHVKQKSDTFSKQCRQPVKRCLSVHVIGF